MTEARGQTTVWSAMMMTMTSESSLSSWQRAAFAVVGSWHICYFVQQRARWRRPAIVEAACWDAIERCEGEDEHTMMRSAARS